QRNLQKTQLSLNNSIARLSSGLRINNASDDAAGLAISESLKSLINATDTAQRNANDGISMVQTAEGALNEITGLLQRMRELAVQAANGTLTTGQRSFLQKEYGNLSAEITRSANNADFNGKKLLDGTLSGLILQIGANSSANDILSVTVSATTA